MDGLNVFIAGAKAGVVSISDKGVLSFAYENGYDGPDLSIAMPVSAGECTSEHTIRTWFSGVLPDNEDMRTAMAIQMGGGRSTFELLKRYGMDLPGAVQVLAQDEAPEPSSEDKYVPVSRDEVAVRLHRIMEEETAWMAAKERWSLGGGQPKLAMFESGGQYYECQGSKASNVIVKPGVKGRKFKHQSLSEGICMRLAKYAGLPCADVRMEMFGDVDAIVVRRYDRAMNPDGEVVRIHQEDLCQAMSVFPNQKYPSEGGPDAGSIMRLLKGSFDSEDRMRFFDALVFNYLIAAPDAHGKNYSLLHTAQGSFRLAPLYDIASIAPYMRARSELHPWTKGHKTYRCAMSIGGENTIGRLRKSNVDRFAKLHGYDADALRHRIENVAAKVKRILPRAIDDFADRPGADEIGSLLTARINALCDITVRNIYLTGNKVRYIDLGEIEG